MKEKSKFAAEKHKKKFLLAQSASKKPFVVLPAIASSHHLLLGKISLFKNDFLTVDDV